MDGDAGKLASGEICTHVAFDFKEMGEIKTAMEVLTKVDLDLAYSSEKLVNLDKLLMHVLACENDLEAMALDNDNSSIDLVEKGFVFDFLSGFLDAEVKELDNFMGSLQKVITDARPQISISRDLTELYVVIEDKLHDSEELLKQSRQQILEIRMQSAKLAKALVAFMRDDWTCGKGGFNEDGLVNTDEKPKMHTVEQKRYILRMLEKSLGRELDLEKKLSEFKQNEEDLKLKQRLTEQVAFCMEEAAEVVWGRFLEAENAKEVLMGTSKEILTQVQIVQYNLNGSMQREDEAKWKLINCMEQLKGRESALQKLENSISELISDNSEVCSLREKVNLLEKEMKNSDSRLKHANALNEENEENIREMEHVIDSLKENIYVAESKADGAEEKINELTETNSELNEELNFLKSTNDSSTKKVSLLEKQLRELEIQLQHAKASSEASQEQQNMLYSAIWDMETLIEELKSKVSKAEIKTDNAEEQCILLSETNMELNKELAFLRSKTESLETSLEQVTDEKVESAKDVNGKTKLIMDMIVQLAMERERIQKQIFGLVEANKVLVRKLQKSERVKSESVHENGGNDIDVEVFPSPKHGVSNGTSGEVSEDAVGVSNSRSFQQVDESSKDRDACETELGSSVSADGDNSVFSEHDSERAIDAEEPNGRNQIYIYIPIIVLLLSFLASYLFNKKIILLDADI